MKRRSIVNIFSALLLVSTTFAQENKLKKADEEFDSYGYIDARKIYLSVVEDGYESAQVFKKLGDTYYFNSEYTEASKWYGKLIENYPGQVESEYFFRAAQTLKSVGAYEEAKIMMEKFRASSPPDTAEKQLGNWQSFEQLANSNNKKYKVTNITSELSGSDFGPSFYENKIVFASSSINTEGSKTHDWNGLPYLDLVEAEINENGNLTNLKRLKGEINSPYHESSAAFTKDGKTVYFTRNNYINGKKKRGKKRLISLKIYKATKMGDDTWGNVIELPFNNDSYSVAHPALNSAENRLYFSSNMPGTYGESDIWYVDILENGNYGKPVNLGSEINTEYRETFPFIDDKNMLFFSSEGHTGLGGLDVFMTPIDNKTKATNLGRPINSNQDDFGFIIKNSEKIGYLSSNRGGINGSISDDIYAVEENCDLIIFGIVTDSNSGQSLDGSIVYLIDENNKIIAQQITDAKGNFNFNSIAECNKPYVVRASNDEKEYQPNEKVINTPNGSQSLEVNLQLTPPECPVNDLGCRLDLQTIYFDFDKHNIRPDAEVELAKIFQALKEYPQISIHIESHTDSRGNDVYNMQLSERRAQSTLEWLVEKGIDKNRLSAKGYGESQLLNECKNGVKCSEQEHQLNRRSVFIITQ